MTDVAQRRTARWIMLSLAYALGLVFFVGAMGRPLTEPGDVGFWLFVEPVVVACAVEWLARRQ